MKKTTPKHKGAQGCMKISSFFTKQVNKQQKQTTLTKSPKKATIQSLKASKEIISIDSDDDFVETAKSSKRTALDTAKKKRKLGDNNKTNFSPPLKKGAILPVKSSPQPSTSGLTSGDGTVDIDVSETASIAPSTSGVTPVKNRPIFNVKTPDKLLSPAALKEFNSPERVMERFLDKAERRLTPVKLNFSNGNTTSSSIYSKEDLTPEKKLDLNSGKSKNTTPKNKTPSKSVGKKSSGEKIANSQNTPNKSKKTPKKLFERSPSNINEFNVEVLKNFVKITPSKKETDQKAHGERSSTKKSLEIQMQNEKTPVKDIVPSTSQYSPVCKVRTKLDFSDCGTLLASDQMTDRQRNSPEQIDEVSKSNSQKKISDETQNKSSTKVDRSGSWQKENMDSNNFVPDIGEDFGDLNFLDLPDFTLDLTKSQHCRIVSVMHRTTEIVLTLRSTSNNQQAVCTLQGFCKKMSDDCIFEERAQTSTLWDVNVTILVTSENMINAKLCIGDTLHVSATKLKDNNWLVDNQNGILVFEPDFLVSTTSVVGSVFCKRKSVLQERFRGFDGSNKFMIVGNMVHILLQDVLKNKLFEYKEVEQCARQILKRKEWIRQIYDSGDSLATIEEDFIGYVPKVVEFVDTYVQSGAKRKTSKHKDNWKGAITEIDDIEENIWCPELGVKGKVDVSIKNGLETIPLEVKTGRASVSLEHRGQVLLYIMMMNKLGYRVSSGLLLYLKEGILKEIPPTASQKRDLIILRNELAYYLTRKPKVAKFSEGIFLEPGEVPEPIDHPHCKNCPYNAICTAYSRYINEDVSSKKSLHQVQDQLSTFLTSAHVEYFMHWSCLLDIEMAQRNDQKILRDIYMLSPQERKLKGQCLINLKVTGISEECNGTICHTFGNVGPDHNPNFMLSGLKENSYVVVSVENRPAVSSGFVIDISASSVTVSLDRNLNKKYPGKLFFLDSYESSTFLTFNLASLALILDTSERSNRLRSIIVDRQPASFQPKLPKILAEKAKPILKRLNKVQQRAVLKAIAANDYFLIKGMPGTGKTATLVALIQLLLELKKSVLITSHTHSAVDNVCLKLMKFGVAFMRLGNEAKMDSNLREYSEHNLTKHCSTPEELEEVYSGVQVLAVTCLGSGHPVLSKRTMDICIVDESTQVLQCSVFRPLYAANTFILLGDPDQLPAVVRSKEALDLGMNESLFERLDSDESRITLNLNYRMNEPITGLANALTYNGELLIGAERVAKATLEIPQQQDLSTEYRDTNWLLKALDSRLENAVQFIDTGPVWHLQKDVSWTRTESYEEGINENQKCLNIFEAAIIYRLVHALIDTGGVAPDQIGVICTYRAQVALLFDLLKQTNVDVNTVDQFQGKDKSVIIYSCSKSKDVSIKQDLSKYDLLEDKRRLNVAITRAKHKLIIVGDLATLISYSTFKKIKYYLEKNVIRLADEEGFNWDHILNLGI